MTSICFGEFGVVQCREEIFFHATTVDDAIKGLIYGCVFCSNAVIIVEATLARSRFIVAREWRRK